MFAPAGTPPAIAARLGATIGHALVDSEVRERLLASGQEPTPGTTEDFAKFVHEEFGKYERLIHDDIKLNLNETSCIQGGGEQASGFERLSVI